MKPTRAQIKAQMKKVNKISIESLRESIKFNAMCEEYYGEEKYSDHDLDQIIDCLDYGYGEMDFGEFDELMKEINSNSGRSD
jgi:hypothetical protein